MKHENAGHAGNHKTELAASLIQGPVAPTAGQESARGSVASSAPASRPVSHQDSESVEFGQRGTDDIVFVFNDGQVRRFSADMRGRYRAWDVERYADLVAVTTAAEADTAANIERTAELWQEQLLPQRRILEFAEQAAALRWPDKERRPHIDFSQLSAAKRPADATNSVWNVYNRVQERLVQGGFEVTFGHNNPVRMARPLTGLERIITLNRDLWDLAAHFATN